LKIKKTNKQPALVSYIKKNINVYLLLLVIIPSALYFRVVNFGYSGLDDGNIISNINNVQGSPLNIKEAFTHDAFMGDKGDTFYRPLQTISFMLDAELGGKEPWIYHLSNLIFHMLTVIALFFFLKKTGIKEKISFLLALLFAINPLFTNAVAWIPARGDILLCLFSLISFITFLEYFNTKKIEYLIFHTVFILFALLSKETAVLIPVLILSYFYFVQRSKFILKDIIPFIIVWSVSFILFFSLRLSIIKLNPSSNIFGIIPFVKNLPVIPITFFKFFFPYSLCTMPFYDKTGIIGGIVILTIFTIITFKIIRGDRRIIIWGGVWFLVFSIPPMFYRSYFASIAYEYFEYRAYLPIIGILLVSGLIINKLTDGFSFNKVLIIAIPILLAYSFITFIHTTAFSDPVSFFTSAIKTNSNNAMAFSERGTAYYNMREMEMAKSDLDNSIRICPVYPVSYFNKGVLYSTSKDDKQAEYYFSQALKYDTLSQDLHMLKSYAYVKLSDKKLNLRKFDETKILLKKGIKMYPEDSRLYNNLGLAYYNTMKYDSAYVEYNKAIEAEKNVYTYYDNRGMAEYHLKDYKNALKDFNKVLDLKPDFQDTWGSRGMTKIELNDNEGAISDLTKVISFNPRVGAAYYFRGIAYSKLNRLNEALVDWKKATELGYKGASKLLEQY
jgi:protein O-mannosyl-transferase